MEHILPKFPPSIRYGISRVLDIVEGRTPEDLQKLRQRIFIIANDVIMTTTLTYSAWTYPDIPPSTVLTGLVSAYTTLFFGLIALRSQVPISKWRSPYCGEDLNRARAFEASKRYIKQRPFMTQERLEKLYPKEVVKYALAHCLCDLTEDEVRALIELGADINDVHPDDITNTGNTPVHTAIANWNCRLAMSLLKAGTTNGLDPDVISKEKHQNTPLLLVIAKGHRIEDADGKPVLYSDLDFIKQLVENNKANLSIPDPVFGWTALHLAYMKRDKTLIEYLKDQGAPTDSKDKENRIPEDLWEMEYEKVLYNLTAIGWVVTYPQENLWNPNSPILFGKQRINWQNAKRRQFFTTG